MLYFSFSDDYIGRKGKSNNGKDPESAGPSSPRASPSNSSNASTAGCVTPAEGVDSLVPVEELHWSKDDKYDAENLLDINYKKHLTRHANK